MKNCEDEKTLPLIIYTTHNKKEASVIYLSVVYEFERKLMSKVVIEVTEYYTRKFSFWEKNYRKGFV